MFRQQNLLIWTAVHFMLLMLNTLKQITNDFCFSSPSFLIRKEGEEHFETFVVSGRQSLSDNRLLKEIK